MKSHHMMMGSPKPNPKAMHSMSGHMMGSPKPKATP